MLVITWDEIAKALDFPSLIAALRDGFIDFSEDRAFVAPLTNIHVPEHNGEMHIKPGYLTSKGDICVKIVTCYYDNPRKGMPTRDGAIVLADRFDGRMKALLADAGLITDMRTAGSSAVAVDALAKKGTITLGLVGAGTQAFWHAAAVSAVRKVEEVTVWGRDEARASAAARRIAQELGIPAKVGTLDVVTRCDVIVSATPAQAPVLDIEKVSSDAVIVAMGADAVGKRELSDRFLAQVETIVADSLVQCRKYGELQWLEARSEGPAVIELGALLAGKAQRSEGGPVVFDSTGVAFQDAVGAALVLERLSASRDKERVGR